MADLRPFASLSAGLLARKGEARPAMRRQVTAMPTASDDLGWNDMGEAQPLPAAAPTPPPFAPVPPVLAERMAIAAQLGAVPEEAAPTPALPEISLPLPRARAGSKAKAAFTLRLDPERHLRLRLACALTHRSAQAVVIEALDALLATIPQIDAAATAAKR